MLEPHHFQQNQIIGIVEAASEVLHAEVCIPDRTLMVKPKTYSSFTIKIQATYDTCQQGHTVQMMALQLLFVVNFATTHHKLQGATKKSLFVNSFSYKSRDALI